MARRTSRSKSEDTETEEMKKKKKASEEKEVCISYHIISYEKRQRVRMMIVCVLRKKSVVTKVMRFIYMIASYCFFL